MSKQHYLVIGDSFLVDQQVHTILASLKKDSKAEFSEQVYYLNDKSLESVLTEARNLPFLATAQIFRLRELSKLKKSDIELLERYFENPSDSTCLIFETDAIGKTDDLYKLFKGQGEILFLESKENRGVFQLYIREKLKTAGKKMSPAAAALLEQEAGDMPSFLDSMLEKLIIYAGDKAEITREMVELFEENWQEANIFNMTDAIVSQNTSQALETMKALLEDNPNDIVGLLGILHWQIKRFWLAAALRDEGQPESVIMKKCKISPRQAPYFKKQLMRFKREKLEKALSGLFQLDWKLKTGRADGPIALESWLVETACR